ncbi:MAG TPA: DUF5011 domain-containing protein [Bacilli bacterium]|nr:DUF5011 domain-containing protein [Bacilli bacterium]
MDEKNKFTLTRGKLILLIILVIITIVFIVLIIPKSSKEEYPIENFERLESKMAEEAKQYLVQNSIVLKESEERRITLKELIDSQTILDKEITDLCEGYVIVKKEGTISTKAYLSCGKHYITDGYKKITTTTTTKTTTSLVDKEKPVIKLNGLSTETINQNTKFVDPGVIAYDNVDGDITSEVVISGSVNTTKSGSYTLNYSVEDKAGNKTQISRIVIVKSLVTTTTRSGVVKTTTRITTTSHVGAPTIILEGSKQMTVFQYGKYVEPGYTAADYFGNSLTSKVVVTGTVNTSIPGSYSKTYTVKDSYNNTTRVVRTVIVTADTTIKLKGISVQRNTITLAKGQQYQVIIYYTPSNATNKLLSWSSNNSSVATVSSTGLVKAIGKGIAVIKTTANDGNYTAYTSVTVN